ncbi:cytochrome bc complex cytochrome b subunit [Robbsia sp. KACC 23696]|uniref:cytochrome b n=1 Tax=Robbsia sp. KACC 23696 TaxID=3149231 RepID=UPI00325ABC3F
MSDGSVDSDAGIVGWIDARLPVRAFWRRHMSGYRVPRNLNFWYVFGSLASLVLVIQYVSGLFLTMHYKPDAGLAFASIERIMREVRWGWLIRYVHTTGASLFFVVLYLHLFRGLIYGSYRRPRELVWVVGCLTFLLVMAEAFFGYLLPWGQMSYWGAQVIVNLFSAIPGVGGAIATWIRGDATVSDATLNRFFALHVVAVPILLLLIVVLHLTTLRQVGSNNPDGIDLPRGDDAASVATREADTVPFHPYFVVKDVLAAAVFLFLFALIVFYAPTMHGYFIEPNNAIPANPLQTPDDITPVWYFMPFYAILRAVTEPFQWGMVVVAALWGLTGLLALGRRSASRQAVAIGRHRRGVVRAMLALLLIAALLSTEAKLWGVVLMLGAVGVWCAVPWLDRAPVRSIRYRPLSQRVWYGAVALAFLGLGVLGGLPSGGVVTSLSQLGCCVYFAFFLGMPWWSARGRCLPLPARLSDGDSDRMIPAGKGGKPRAQR